MRGKGGRLPPLAVARAWIFRRFPCGATA